jgi:putative intracellular protease/amidase
VEVSVELPCRGNSLNLSRWARSRARYVTALPFCATRSSLTAMRNLGANYVQAGLWKGFAVRDGNLITGQQNFSGAETAELVMRAVGQ